jgi:hypothetical protein
MREDFIGDHSLIRHLANHFLLDGDKNGLYFQSSRKLQASGKV